MCKVEAKGPSKREISCGLNIIPGVPKGVRKMEGHVYIIQSRLFLSFAIPLKLFPGGMDRDVLKLCVHCRFGLDVDGVEGLSLLASDRSKVAGR